MNDYRLERDSFGEIQVPTDRLWGAQTARSLHFFPISGETMDPELLKALVLIKKAYAFVNGELGNLSSEKSQAIMTAADEVLSYARFDAEFPLSVWQTGSGTQTNMNVNEVLANRASELLGGTRGEKRLVHPNDEVNLGQSSNDVFPSAMNLSAITVLGRDLIPAVSRLRDSLQTKSRDFWKITKIGRTHLMDATPLTLGQEFSGYVAQLEHSLTHLENSFSHLYELALGGTAVGTGLNAPTGVPERVVALLSTYSGHSFVSAPNKFEALAANDALVHSHGALRGLAATLFKIVNDIRWLSSGPRCGLGELALPENEPGSSIMPGKVNPTQCESLIMIAVQVMGNDTTIGLSGALGNFELNVMRPVLIHNYLQSVRLLSQGSMSFEEFCVRGIGPRYQQIHAHLERSLMLVTALNPIIGYDKAAQITKKAQLENKTLKEAAVELGFLTPQQFEEWVKPESMTNLPNSD